MRPDDGSRAVAGQVGAVQKLEAHVRDRAEQDRAMEVLHRVAAVDRQADSTHEILHKSFSLFRCHCYVCVRTSSTGRLGARGDAFA